MKTFISLSALLFVFLLPISAQIQIGQDINSSVGSVVISADGSRIAVGIPSADGASPNRVDLGRVTVYEWEENEWVQLGESIFGKNVENYAGVGLAMSAGNTKRI